VESIGNGKDALELLRESTYDFIILDWHLPELSGVEMCRYFRANGGTTPILMLTGKTDIADKEAGLDAGADDYLTKPFHPRELCARLRARQASNSTPGDELKIGDLTLDLKKYQLHRKNVEIDLLPLEFALLEFFMRNPGRVLVLTFC
jgi:Response regulators consisting of a CheY-like receiver domain and a winged-helix DNA-binding domain